MKHFIQSTNRTQVTLFPEQPEDYVADDNPVRAVDVFVEQLDPGKLGFVGVEPMKTGRLKRRLFYFFDVFYTAWAELRTINVLMH